MNNARFWVYVNSDWVKLTLRPEETLSWGFSCRTDEGYYKEGQQWEHTGEGVMLESYNESRDCDGKHGYSSSEFCLLSCLRSVLCAGYGGEDCLATPFPDEKGQPLFRPLWREEKPVRCYDEYAEVAGY